jgi:hypothetical protein
MLTVRTCGIEESLHGGTPTSEQGQYLFGRERVYEGQSHVTCEV